MGKFGTTELVVIFLIVLVLFGSKKLPEIGKGLGKGISNFRKSVKGEDEIDVTPQSDPSNPDQISKDQDTATDSQSDKTSQKAQSEA